MGGQTEAGSLLDKIGHVHGHLLHGGVVECLNVPQCSLVILGYHVNGYSLSAETTSPTNPVKNKKGSPSLQISSLWVCCSCSRWTKSWREHFICLLCIAANHVCKPFMSSPVDVVFPVGWQVVVDDKGNLLNINTSGLRRNKHLYLHGTTQFWI